MREPFLAGCTPELRARLEDDPELEPQLRQFVEAARSARPGLDAPIDPFLAYVAEHLAEDASADLSALRAGDLLLAFACARGHAAAIATFEEELFAEIDPLCRRVSETLDIDELRQRLRCRLFLPDGDKPPRITTYAGVGELRNWFRVMVMRLALNAVRDTRAADEALLDEMAPVIEGPELEPYKARYAEAFRAAFEQAMTDLDVRARLLLRYQLVDALRVEDIAAVFGVHRSSAARWLAAGKARLLERTQVHLRRTLGLPEEELQPVIDLILSRIELTWSRLLP